MGEDSQNAAGNTFDRVGAGADPTFLAMQMIVAASLASGTSRLRRVPVSDRIRCLVDGLRALGVQIRVDDAGMVVGGCGGYWPEDEAELTTGRYTAVLHLLIAACSIKPGRYSLIGEDADQASTTALAHALADLGVMIDCDHRGRAMRVAVAGGLHGGETRLERPASDSAIGALLLAAPYARTDVFIEVGQGGADPQRLAATKAVIERFGGSVVDDAGKRLIVPGSCCYRAIDFSFG